MIWVETGAESEKWNSNPIQIGNPGDPGLRALLVGNEGGDLIVPPIWKKRLTLGSVVTIPSHSIAAGVGYLLMRMANYTIGSVPDADITIYDVKVQAGDSIAKIAEAKGSTIAMMQKLNPSVQLLRPGQVLKYRKAAMKKVVVGWKKMTTSNIATVYNSGDSRYAKKLDYALALIRKAEVQLCVS